MQPMRFPIIAFPAPKGVHVDTNLLGERGLAQPELSSESGNLPYGKGGSRGRLGRFRNVPIPANEILDQLAVGTHWLVIAPLPARCGRFIDAEHLSELLLG